ncbi:MAG TPA: MaoC family dehydratase [Dehalococcoidia bacterium]|nr:MaoC family dehydratase [Dehalococcoidia bacterium]
MNKGLTLDQLSMGQTHQSKCTVTQEMVEEFAKATGDHNPIHLDESYARGTVFRARVAHGMLLAGILSGVLGMQFPGVGTIYLSQSLKFVKPVFLGDEVTWHIKVVELLKERNRARLETVCANQRGETVLTGEALVMPPA